LNKNKSNNKNKTKWMDGIPTKKKKGERRKRQRCVSFYSFDLVPFCLSHLGSSLAACLFHFFPHFFPSLFFPLFSTLGGTKNLKLNIFAFYISQPVAEQIVSVIVFVALFPYTGALLLFVLFIGVHLISLALVQSICDHWD